MKVTKADIEKAAKALVRETEAHYARRTKVLTRLGVRLGYDASVACDLLESCLVGVDEGLEVDVVKALTKGVIDSHVELERARVESRLGGGAS